MPVGGCVPKYIGIIVGKLLRKDKFGVKSFILAIQDFVIKFWRCTDGKESWFFFSGFDVVAGVHCGHQTRGCRTYFGITVA